MRNITVTSPLLPDFSDFTQLLEKIWESRILTNNGIFHQELEEELCKYLGVKYISLFANGTIALICAFKALEISGEVITTPYSFVATSHSLVWNGIKPVFVDIEQNGFNIDSNKIKNAITNKTSAILPVHVYGLPCNTDKIGKIAKNHKLKVIYDAAHAFGVKVNNKSLLNEGDLSILSFHITKAFSTIEGGAIVCKDSQTKHKLDNLRNFGFRGETIIEEIGINAKLNEIQSIFGLLSLKKITEAIEKRNIITQAYKKLLGEINGITCYKEFDTITYNYSYFPIVIDQDKFLEDRDELYERLKKNGIYSRKYFYPLISNLPVYKSIASANPKNLPIANRIAEKVLCLPIYHDLAIEDVSRICSLIINK